MSCIDSCISIEALHWVVVSCPSCGLALMILCMVNYEHVTNNYDSEIPEPKKPKKPLLNVLKKLTPHENIYTIPNILTVSRLIAAPIVGYLVLHDQHAWAFGLFAYAGITDLVDGWIARKWNLQTVVGTVIDPMADKTLMTILTVCLAVKGALPGMLIHGSISSLHCVFEDRIY